ncbi:MAG: hypothetical protein U0105_16350 [Candidatus Obscuribacterales bacterium]
MHCADGPAIKYADGYQQYFLHGTSVSFYVIDRQPTVEMMDNEWNNELRRIMLNRFRNTCSPPVPKFSTSTNAARCMVHIVNKTPESDGNFHDLFIRVPPDMRTCRQAVASTFGLEEHEYEPQRET